MVPRAGGAHRFAEKQYPKNRKPRRLAISEGLATSVEQVIASGQLKPGDRLFAQPGVRRQRHTIRRSQPRPNGVPVAPDTFRTEWHRARHRRRRPDAAYARPTRLQHQLDAGRRADLATVKQRAGHAHSATTDRYLAALDDADNRALNALVNLWARRPARQGGANER